jgi:hypothetical protein
MNSYCDIDRFIKDPSLLIELCRDVIDRIDSIPADPKTSEKQMQLREIGKAVEKLEKMGVSVPDSLRAEKIRLISSLSIKTDAIQTLANLIEGFEKILNDLKTRIGRPPIRLMTKSVGKRSPHLEKNQTPRTVIISCLLDSLNELGGSAYCNDVLALMEKKLQDKFLPGDLENDGSFGEKWKHNAHWARLKLANDDILIKDSPRGYWQLSKRAK